jgi:uncharacterized GH25 family protein
MKTTFLMGLFVIFAGQLFAHDLYLQGSPFILGEPGQTKIGMYLAEAFPGKKERWRSEKTVDFRVVAPESESKAEEKTNVDPEVMLAGEGTYVIGWSSTPSYISIDAKAFDEYIEAEGYDNVIAMRKTSAQAAEQREKYTRFLKTFLQVGSKTTSNFNHTFGYKIEIIPMNNPYEVSAGEDFQLQVRLDGKPLANVRLMATFDTYSTEHDVYEQTVQTNSEGIAVIKITKPGIWMIRTSYMLPIQNDPKADWESYWANISFQVK